MLRSADQTVIFWPFTHHCCADIWCPVKWKMVEQSYNGVSQNSHVLHESGITSKHTCLTAAVAISGFIQNLFNGTRRAAHLSGWRLIHKRYVCIWWDESRVYIYITPAQTTERQACVINNRRSSHNETRCPLNLKAERAVSVDATGTLNWCYDVSLQFSASEE